MYAYTSDTVRTQLAIKLSLCCSEFFFHPQILNGSTPRCVHVVLHNVVHRHQLDMERISVFIRRVYKTACFRVYRNINRFCRTYLVLLLQSLQQSIMPFKLGFTATADVLTIELGACDSNTNENESREDPSAQENIASYIFTSLIRVDGKMPEKKKVGETAIFPLL